MELGAGVGIRWLGVSERKKGEEVEGLEPRTDVKLGGLELGVGIPLLESYIKIC